MGRCQSSAGIRVRTIIQSKFYTIHCSSKRHYSYNTHRLLSNQQYGHYTRLAHSCNGLPTSHQLSAIIHFHCEHTKQEPWSILLPMSCQPDLCWPLSFPKSFHMLKDGLFALHVDLLMIWTKSLVGPAYPLVHFLKRQWRVVVGNICSQIWLYVSHLGALKSIQV
jgi:hypothetical protein